MTTCWSEIGSEIATPARVRTQITERIEAVFQNPSISSEAILTSSGLLAYALLSLAEEAFPESTVEAEVVHSAFKELLECALIDLDEDAREYGI